MVADLADMYRGFDLLREMTQDEHRVLVAGHDAEVHTRFPGRVAGLPAQLADLVVRIAAVGTHRHEPQETPGGMDNSADHSG